MSVATADLLAADPFASGLGISHVDGGPGWLVLEMTVTDRHLNFFGWAHGGALFALADTTFGLASNSREHLSIGIDTHMAFCRGAAAGDVLRTRADEVSRTKKTAVYRVDVTRGDETLATLTGTVHVTDKPVALPTG